MSHEFTLENVSEPELRVVAELVALAARLGDCIALSGELGAGKTTFARAFVRALLDDAGADVPSPTFTLMQAYDTSRYPVSHLDLYRLSDPGEVAELGLREALAHGVVLVEWPEHGPKLPDQSRLDIALSDGPRPEVRCLRMTAHGDWARRLQRLEAGHRFLRASLGAGDAANARVAYLHGDASHRTYARIGLGGDTCVLMNAPRMPDGPPIRNGLAYSRIAHLAEDVRPFVAVAAGLLARGLLAPRIRSADLAGGFLLLDDFGDLTFGRALAAGHSQAELWRAAVDVLLALRASGPPVPMPVPGGEPYTLPLYDREALEIETELLLDWYWPALKGEVAPAAARAEFAALWARQFDQLLALPAGWVLRDFHSPNLMWRPRGQGTGRVGVLDFQDALSGPWAFDLVSLLQDARLNVPAALEAELLEHYCRRAAAIEPDFDRTSFAYAYAALGAQRNTKILGIFARLARRDGKPDYLQHMPRLWGYLGRNLQHPSLAPLRSWYEHHFPPSAHAVPLAG